MIRRREFITLVGGAGATWPVGAWGQQDGKQRTVAVLEAGDGGRDGNLIQAFVQELQKAGWVEGKNLKLEMRISQSDFSMARRYASELISTAPDVVLATNTQMAQYLREQSKATPIIFIRAPDPVGSGLVQSFARPGGNLTGFTNFDFSLGQKWLELLKIVAPNIAKVQVLLQKDNPFVSGYASLIDEAGPKFSVHVTTKLSDGASNLSSAIQDFANEQNGGLIVPPSAMAVVHRDVIIKTANEHRLPAIYPYREFAMAGGLMSYGIDEFELYRNAANYVARVLRGAKPAELPVQSPSKFELVVNLGAAKAIGLQIPESFLLYRADEVIE